MHSHVSRTLSILAFSFAARAGLLTAQDEATKVGGYDYIPGETVLYAEDFQSALGSASLLRRLFEASSRMSVDAREGMPFLHTRPPASFVAVLKEPLTDRFTIDFDFFIPGNQVLRISALGTGLTDPSVIDIGPHSVAAGNHGDDARSVKIEGLIPDFTDANTYHASVTMDGTRARVYVARVKELDVPKLDFGRSNRVKFEFIGGDDPDLIENNTPIWITNISIAAGGNPLSYADLVSKGHIATQGILFETGSDRIRPESAPTLKLIGDMLTSHADLKIMIEGHSDNIGTTTLNQVLSERRANAVRQYLVSNFHIDGSRLSATGLGDTKPVTLNTTPNGRQQNRRVELVKQ